MVVPPVAEWTPQGSNVNNPKRRRLMIVCGPCDTAGVECE